MKAQYTVATNQFGESFTKEEYMAFMYSPENEYNCDHCPHNDGFSGRLPCGQQNCWVTVHCRASEEEDEG